MSIYARYFDQETLVHTVDELLDFLRSIPDINVTPQLEQDVMAYMDSDIPYPKRYKVRPRVYFILIKSNAETMSEFRANNKKQATTQTPDGTADKKDLRQLELAKEVFGWYYCSLAFKRVILIPETLKYQYQDAEFTAYVKGNSPMECYNRVIDHLQTRQDIDSRSQFPSPKGSSYHFEYVGEALTRREAEHIATSSTRSRL
ncbi:MAG: hypothetical protein J6M53_05860 [Bacteroidaceae bacterium]|nr:hypothetical protein [Bacteroidaceae bacterium]